MRPVVALLTDFGVRDHYVGTMKGVILGICPEATLVDISHDIGAHDVTDAAFELAASYRYFPAGTIFLAVVDPGVGTTRRAIAAEAAGFRFVAPDNGILTLVLHEAASEAVELSNPRYARATISRTFEGRDRFAPAAAWLAAGVDIGLLGPRAGGLHRLDVPAPRVEPGAIAGEVMRVDRFGNLVTNIDRRTFDSLAAGAIEVHAGAHRIAGLAATYGDVPPAAICALFGSTEHLEIAANGRSAATLLEIGRGAPVRVVKAA
jgi:S-adenosylmethionine hydrolase